MDDRDWFAIQVLVGGFVVVVFSYLRTLIDLNYKKGDKNPTYLWGELRSENSKFTFMGWIVSIIITTVSLASSFILIYYYIKPFSWWLLQASTITLFVGAFIWYDLTRITFCRNYRDLAAIPVLLTTIGNGLMLVTIVHPDTHPLEPETESHNVAYRMTLVMLGMAFVHHLVMDVFIWYFSFVYMKVNSDKFCATETAFETVAVNVEEDNRLRNRGMSKLITSQRVPITVPGHAC